MRTRMSSSQRRAAIVASAVHLFAEKGFRGTTTRQLAAAVGVTEPVLYQHFRTKGELYSAIIESQAAAGQHYSAGLRKAMDEENDCDFLAALGNLILDRNEQDPDFTRLLMFSALERHELAPLFFERQVLPFFETVAGYIRRRVRNGAFRPLDPEIAARAFIGMFAYQGLIAELFHDLGTRKSRKKIVKEMVGAFLEGVCRPAAPPR
ncbi:MAG TPA: TetR/AcrR family transcriptional regulator [Bryobacteraceae bacterium]|nr:TetR/AcrR family transcriptional regulator [Bryobacteraceae bacterium]